MYTTKIYKLILFYFRRESLIKEIVGRNIDLPIGDINEIALSEKELFVVEQLNIREEIIYNAKAILAVTQKKYDSFTLLSNYLYTFIASCTLSIILL